MSLPSFDPRLANTPSLWARFYRELGWQVVPCWRPGEPPNDAAWKRPKLAWKAFQEALVGQVTFDKWYPPGGRLGEFSERWNMGLITGACSSRVFVIDIDAHSKPEALAWWRGVLEVHNSRIEPETVVQRTGGGGFQLLFRAPDGVTIPTCRMPIGIDIRGQGGFAVLPPSLHDSGNLYQWLDGHAPWEVEVALAPDWLLEEIDALCRAYGNVRVTTPEDDPWGAPPTPQQQQKTVSPATDYSVTGLRIDGRETLMRDMVWHGVLELYRACPIRPHPDHWEREAQPVFERYVRAVLTRLPGAGTEAQQREALERENRGWSLFWYKWRRDMSRWETSGFKAAAARPNPKDKTLPGAGGVLSIPGQGESKPPISPHLDIIDAGAPHPKPPPRQWLMRGTFCRQYISSVMAAGGVGKTALRMLQYLALATGRPLSGQQVYRRCRVLFVSLEDDDTEIQRRIDAALAHYGLPASEVAGWLYYKAPKLLRLAETDPATRKRIRGELETMLRATIEQMRDAGTPIDLIGFDPFVHLHSLEENNSGDMTFVCSLLAALACDYGIAVDAPHHVRKGALEPGNAEAGRGSSGIKDAARLVHTLCPMSAVEALKFGIDPDERRFYIRFDPGKLNIAPSAHKAIWFKLVSQPLDNGTPDYPDGDEVQVAVPWEPPTAWDFSIETANRLLDVIQGGCAATGRYGGDVVRRYSLEGGAKGTPRDAVALAQTYFDDKTEAQCREILKGWLKEGVLKNEDYKDQVTGRMVGGLFVDDTKRPGRVLSKVEIKPNDFK